MTITAPKFMPTKFRQHQEMPQAQEQLCTQTWVCRSQYMDQRLAQTPRPSPAMTDQRPGAGCAKEENTWDFGPARVLVCLPQGSQSKASEERSPTEKLTVTL